MIGDAKHTGTSSAAHDAVKPTNLQRREMTDAVKSAERPGGICTCGSKTDEPCPRPAVAWWGLSALCVEHYREAEFQERVDGLTFALELLEDMMHEANGSGSGVLANSLLRSKSELKSKLADAEGVLGMASRDADQHKTARSELGG